MLGFEKLIEFAKKDGGKLLVLDEKGEPQFVIMSIAEYSKLTADSTSDSRYERLSARVDELSEQTEELNRQILKAQMEDLEEGEEEEEEEEVKTEAGQDFYESMKNVPESFYIEPLEN